VLFFNLNFSVYLILEVFLQQRIDEFYFYKYIMEIKIIYIKYEKKNTAISLKDHQVLKTY